MKSLKAVLSQGRSLDQPCWIGSVKTNIGHLEAAAGIAGLIKVVLCLQHQEIPPHLHLKQLNPYISLAGTPFAIPTERQSWYVSTEPRLAGVSSFSFGGTNSHVILQEAAVFSQVVKDDIKRPWHLLTLSAKTEKALQQLAGRYENYLINHPEASIADICYTANTGRSHFAHRLAVVVDSREQLIEKLAAGASGKETSGLFNNQPKKIAFLFTGQGSQYINMGRQLYETQPTFRKTLDYCAQILRPYLEKPLLEVLYPTVGETSPLNETVYAQPALFALEYALFDLWKSWGVEPSAVMGHSVGEYVAATVAGVFSLEEGLKLIATRARLMQPLPSIGEVSHAFHSPLMEPMLAEFEAVAKEITYNQPRIPLISNVTGQLATPEIATPEYWVNHVRQTVHFAQSIQTLHQSGYKLFLEIGPKPILLEMSRQCLPEDAGIWLPSLCPPQEDWQQMLSSLGLLYVNKMKIDWSGFDKDYVRRQLELPTYPFQRQRYWLETSENGDRENGHQKDILENSSSLIVNLLNQVNPKQLAQELKIAEKLTEQEQNLLPKLLTILINLQSSEPAGILQQLKKAPERDRIHLITNYLQSVVAQLLGFHDSPSPDSQLGFFDMGMDYSMMLELRDLLQTSFGCSIAVTTLSEHFNIQKLAKYLHGEMFELELEEELEIDNSSETEDKRTIVNREVEPLDEEAIADAIKQELIATALQEEIKEIKLLLNQEN
jgi:acyl transferase domain-containing protein